MCKLTNTKILNYTISIRKGQTVRAEICMDVACCCCIAVPVPTHSIGCKLISKMKWITLDPRVKESNLLALAQYDSRCTIGL